MPGVPGDIQARMELDHHGNYHIEIPAAAVSPGTWRYAIEVPLQGSVHRFPREGYRTFDVLVPYYPDYPDYYEDLKVEVRP